MLFTCTNSSVISYDSPILFWQYMIYAVDRLTFTTLGPTIRFINQLREIGDQLKGSIFGVPMGVKLGFLRTNETSKINLKF